MTVGTGTRKDSDITIPLKNTLERTHFQKVAFLVTSQSRRNARKVVEDEHIPEEKCVIVDVKDKDDINQVFESCCHAIEHLIDLGFESQNILLDFTTGTKVMSAALVLAGCRYGCGELIYISGKRENGVGVVITGTESRKVAAPYAWLLTNEIEYSYHAIRSLHFEEAIRRLEHVDEKILRNEDRRFRNALLHIARAYKAWDDFDHTDFQREYGAIDTMPSRAEEFELSKNNRKLVQEHIINAISNKKFTPELIADVVNNAVRRRLDGRFDDAVARLYRATEMLAQYRLQTQFDIDTSDVSLEKIGREDLHTTLSHYRDPTTGKIKIGLHMSYSLLETLGDPLGKEFRTSNETMKTLKNMLARRNKSITAHGLKNMSRETFEELYHSLLPLLKNHIKDFNTLSATLQFPWLKDVQPE